MDQSPVEVVSILSKSRNYQDLMIPECSPPMDPSLSQLNPVILMPYFFKKNDIFSSSQLHVLVYKAVSSLRILN